MGQKNCTIKDEDELDQIIGKYRMTSEFNWVDLKTGIDNQMKQTVGKKDSYSSDSLDEYCEESIPDIDKSKTILVENFDFDVNNEKSISQASSEISSVHDNTSITSSYSFEIIEETEALQTENITESIDIRISPRNSTVMSFNCSNNFYSEFSLVANVEVQIPDANDNFNDTKNVNGPSDVDIQAKNIVNNEDMLNENKNGANENQPIIQSIDINANDSKNTENKEKTKEGTVREISQKKTIDEASDPPSACNHVTLKKNEHYASKIEIIKQEKKIASSIEKKIAEEIKAMKEREEDLRAMREKLAREMSEKVAAIKTSNLDNPELPNSVTAVSPTPNCDQKPVIKKAETVKVENTYTKACVFAIKRKDASAKNDNSEMNNNSPCAIVQKESPVEREIRIAKEREEELKREREHALKFKLEMESFHSEFSANETDVDSALSICSDSSFDSVSKLAPMFPNSVSPEVNNGNGISLYSSSAGSICSLESLSQRERQIIGSNSISGSINGSLLSPSPDCKPGFPFSSPRISAEKRSKSIDMERFISSKGKEIKFKGDTVSIPGFNNYYEIRPPQVKKGEEMTCKRFITAATKIRNELKEMQEREEQFKKERATLQQDIENIKNTEENENTNQESNPINHNLSPTKINHSDSSEDFEKNNKQDNSVNPARRRSILIDEWEQRIQKSNLQP